MAATKVRVPVIAVTPSREKVSRYSVEEKQSILDNFDLEVADKTSRFRDALSATLESFLRRQETEMLRIPKDLRGMTLDELMKKWGGSWKETMQKITKDRIDAREREQEREEAETREKAASAEGSGVDAKGKRKRATAHSVESTPNRNSKTARHTQTPMNSRRPLAPSSAVNSSTSRRTGHTRGKSSTSTPIKPVAGPSSLPQNHQFNPSLPAKTLTSFNTPSGPSSSSRRANHGNSAETDSESEPSIDGTSSEDEDDLPDPEEYEARILAKSTSKSSRSKGSKPSHPSGKLRRAPSLHFRQSLAPGEVRVQQSLPSTSVVPPGAASGAEETDAEGEALSHVDLGDGRMVSFNPFRVDPDQVKLEIAEGGGLPEKEQVRVAKQIREEIIKALTNRIGKWKVMS